MVNPCLLLLLKDTPGYIFKIIIRISEYVWFNVSFADSCREWCCWSVACDRTSIAWCKIYQLFSCQLCAYLFVAGMLDQWIFIKGEGFHYLQLPFIIIHYVLHVNQSSSKKKYEQKLRLASKMLFKCWLWFNSSFTSIKKHVKWAKQMPSSTKTKNLLSPTS